MRKGQETAPPVLRFLAHVRAEGACLLWTGELSKGKNEGYGRFYLGNKPVKAHRWWWEQTFQKPAPPVLHHTCPHKACVGWWHLEPTTRADHRKHHGRKKEFCKRGHNLQDNAYMAPGRNFRACRACVSIRSLAAYHRKKARQQHA